jgi:hypothetical protein
MVVDIEPPGIHLIHGPAFMSETGICFDFLMSLPKTALASIRKLKFHTNPFYWQHQRVFEFITKATNVDDVELCFDTERLWEQPLDWDVSTLPWSARHNNTLDIYAQKEVMAIYDICKLNGLQRLAITFVSRGIFYGPILHDQRAQKNLIQARLISLFRSKMLLEGALRRSKVPECEEKIVFTSMMSRKRSPYGSSGLNQTIDHLHSNVAPSTTISLPLTPSPSGYSIMPFGSLSPNRNITEQLVYESPCPVCGEMGTMRYAIREDGERELEQQKPFTLTSTESVASFAVKSWPDQLDKKVFYELVTGNEAKTSKKHQRCFGACCIHQ